MINLLTLRIKRDMFKKNVPPAKAQGTRDCEGMDTIPPAKKCRRQCQHACV
jgi:hypothetical protein